MKSLMLIFLSATSLYSSPSADSCEYYQELEERWECADTSHSYLLNYGLKYCEIFLNMAQSVDASLSTFLHNNAFCLQKALEQFDLNEDNQPSKERCGELERFAFGSHSPCYEQNGFQDLKLSNQAKIVRTVTNLDILLKPRLSLAQGLDIGLLSAVTKAKKAHCALQ